MAKVKHNDFLETVDEVITNAKNAGILHLYAEGRSLNGRTITINGQAMKHFGTTGYLGLEQDNRLKDAAIDAIKNCGTQFPLSKSYISHPLYAELESSIRDMYQAPVIITKNSTLGHLAVIPTAVQDEDAVILDHQVHWSVQSATQVLKTRGIPVEMIRHNNMDMLEDKIKKLAAKSHKIWFMADGVYSMYGDYAPLKELRELAEKYSQLHLYFDDVHGMSWCGQNGTGYIKQEYQQLTERMILFGTLSKTFGASGAVMVCENKALHSKIKNFGGPLTFSAQLEPASVAAAIASAKIHLSPEIYSLQEELQQRISHFNKLLAETDLPLIEKNNTPVFYIGTGLPVTGYKLVKFLMEAGFFVNLGLFPAVPVKNTGVRITVSRHNTKEDITNLVEALKIYYPMALTQTGNSLDRVYRVFKLPVPEKKSFPEQHSPVTIQLENSITKIDKNTWNKLFRGRGSFDWDGLNFLEKAFSGNQQDENNWIFRYIIIRNKENKPILATFFTVSLWKDDMLAPVSISLEIENKRKKEPYYLTSKVLSMGSLFTEGEHLYLNSSDPSWREAFDLLFQKTEELDRSLKADMLIIRDFEEDEELNTIFHNQGFIKVAMPESCIYDDFTWSTNVEYVKQLSSRSRRHYKTDIEPYRDKYNLEILSHPSDELVKKFYRLYENVKNNNPGLNTFLYPVKLFHDMSRDTHWEFIVLTLKSEYREKPSDDPTGVMFCYKNNGTTYVPALIGMDYRYAYKYQVYRQLLFCTIQRAKELGMQKIDFGMTAAFEKRKVGARVSSKYAYLQTDDNYILELLGLMRNES